MILVTGGAGFIGSVLIGELNKLGHEDIIIVDRLEDSIKWKNIRNLKYSEYIHADRFVDDENIYELEEVLDSLTCIYHIGACSSTTEMDMDFLMRNNVDYSKIMYDIALDKDIPFIYASSAATYGDGELGYSDDHSKIANLKALNPYGYSKQLFDEWVLKQDEKPRHWFGFKFFNVFGPNEYHKDDMRSLVHKAFGQINDSGQVRLFKSHKEGYEDGKQLRDFIYVVDVVKAMITASETSKESHSGIYNLGTGQARSFYDLTVATFNAMGREPKIEFFDMPERLRGQYQYFTQADMTKFNKVFADFSFSTLEEGVTQYVQDFLLKSDPHYNA